MCFWATRYDCFADKEELKLGVETIKRLLSQVEKGQPLDRQIAVSFNWDKIRGNENLPFPYIVSFTSRPDNSYMWIEGFDDIIAKFGISPTSLRELVSNEYSRKRNNGSILYYGKLLLHINQLKGIYVKSNDTKECVVTFLKENNITIPIIQVD